MAPWLPCRLKKMIACHSDFKKICTGCKAEQEITEFYAHPKTSDGHLNKCKACCRAGTIKNRNKNIDYYKAYDSLRARLPNRIAARKKYLKTQSGAQCAKEAKKKWALNNKHKRLAHSRLWKAILSGKIVQMPCEHCGKKAHAHHDDYTKPFDVKWLCPKHHSAEHSKARVKTRLPF